MFSRSFPSQNFTIRGYLQKFYKHELNTGLLNYLKLNLGNLTRLNIITLDNLFTQPSRFNFAIVTQHFTLYSAEVTRDFVNSNPPTEILNIRYPSTTN